MLKVDVHQKQGPMQRPQSVVEKRLRFIGHILRMSDDGPPKRALRMSPLDGKGKRERPRVT